jgi:hypothetical protein
LCDTVPTVMNDTEELLEASASLWSMLDAEDMALRRSAESLEDLARHLSQSLDSGADLRLGLRRLEKACNAVLDRLYEEQLAQKFVGAWRKRHHTHTDGQILFEDAVGEAWIVIREQLPYYKKEGNLEGFLRICVYRHLNEWCGRTISPVSLSRDESRKRLRRRGLFPDDDQNNENEENSDGTVKPIDWSRRIPW